MAIALVDTIILIMSINVAVAQVTLMVVVIEAPVIIETPLLTMMEVNITKVGIMFQVVQDRPDMTDLCLEMVSKTMIEVLE